MIKRFFSFIILFCIINAVYADKNRTNDAVESYLRSLPLHQRLSQLFLVNIQGDKSYVPVEYITLKDSDDIVPVVPGGCLFFNYNIATSAAEVIEFTSSIASYCDKHGMLRPYIAVDQEGGYVNRLRNLTVPLPSNRTVAENYTAKQAFELYNMQAKQMRALGFDMNLAPVTEPLNSENAQFLDDRSYGERVKTVVYSIACIRAYRQGGINCIIKHFPGNTNVDPHSGLPEISMPQKNVYDELLLPFFLVSASEPAGILMSHAKVKEFLEPGKSGNLECIPACLSKFWCTDILRDAFGYEGLILSDDIFMAALQDNGYSPETAAVMALNAGVDIIMLSEKKFLSVLKVLSKECQNNPVFAQKVFEAEKKVIKYKIDAGILSVKSNPDKEDENIIVSVSLPEQKGSERQRLLQFESVWQSYRKNFK
ncbi:MAG: glycoside hydrolase family 3 protein [Treponema sp.]|nr:glycoside hydrolase family 3 protein [Treponema sp.]